MPSEVVIREEPGEYRIVARYRDDGGFLLAGESAGPITLTVRVEDVWSRIPSDRRRCQYRVSVTKDGGPEVKVLENVAPDARIFVEFERSFEMEFT